MKTRQEAIAPFFGFIFRKHFGLNMGVKVLPGWVNIYPVALWIPGERPRDELFIYGAISSGAHGKWVSNIPAIMAETGM